MVRMRLSKISLPLAIPVSFLLTLFVARFFEFSFGMSLMFFCLFFIGALCLLSLSMSSFDYDKRSILSAEIVEVENFLSIFSSYLRLGLSPELSLINSCRQYAGVLKPLIDGLVGASIYSGVGATDALLLFAQRVESRDGKRLLLLFSRSLNRDSEKFGRIAFKILRHLRRNRVLKGQVDLLFSRMKIRVSLLSLVFSAILAMLARFFPVILLFMGSLGGGGFSALNFQVVFDETSIFMALGALSFLNTYFVSVIVYHDHPLILSFTSCVIYFLSYLLAPSLLRWT